MRHSYPGARSRITVLMRTTATACCLVILALLGCRSTGSDGPVVLPLDVNWLLTTMDTSDDVTIIVPGDVQPTLRFDWKGAEVVVSGFSGVNRYSGSCTTTEDGDIAFSPLATTRMAGSPGAMTLEQRFLAHLQGAKSFTHAGTTLKILSETGSMEFRAE
jgi:heat shock protein HslJ